MDIRSNKHAQWQIHPGFWGGQRAEGRPYSQRSPPGPHEWLLIDQACALLDAFRLRGDSRERSPGTHTANAEIDPVWDFNAFVAKIPGHTRFTQITLRLALLGGRHKLRWRVSNEHVLGNISRCPEHDADSSGTRIECHPDFRQSRAGLWVTTTTATAAMVSRIISTLSQLVLAARSSACPVLAL